MKWPTVIDGALRNRDSGVHALQLVPRVAFDQQWDEVTQRSVIECGVHIVDNAFHG